MKTFFRAIAFIVAGAVAALAQTPSVTNIWFTGTSHSITLVHFSSSGWGNGWLRVRYIQAPGTCTTGTGGNIVATGYGAGLGQTQSSTDMREAVGGLLPNTTYQVCPEISNNNVNWSSGAGGSVTTLPLPAVHPAIPLPPANFNTSYPNTTGYTQVTVAADGHDLASDLTTAQTRQCSNGTVINIPAGTTYSGQLYMNSLACDAVKFQPSAVNTSGNTITLPSHGYTEGQGIIFGTWYACPVAHVSGNQCNTNGAGLIVPGQLYYAHVIDANTIQVYSGAPMASGGTLIPLINGGALDYAYPISFLIIVKWPRPLHWIIIRTATSDSQFVPEHVRVSPAWVPKMGIVQLPNLYLGTSPQNYLFSPDPTDGNEMTMNANIRFTGVELTYTPSADLGSDVVPHGDLVGMFPWHQNIIFDRCYFHSLPPPDRESQVFLWNGLDVAIVDSYIDGMQFYHPNYAGFAVAKKSATQFTVTGNNGIYNWGSGKVALNTTATVNLTGTNPGTASAFVYFTNASQLNVVLPPGMTGTCSGYSPCTVFGGATPGNGLGVNAPNGEVFPSIAAYNNRNYFADPIFSTSGICSTTSTILPNNSYFTATAQDYGQPAELGVQFTSDANGYICGVRFAKPSGETGTHKGSLWTASGVELSSGATQTETGSGWQTITFPAPVAITAATTYVASYRMNTYFYSVDNYFNNLPVDSTPLHALPTYVASNGTCNFSDTWPKNFIGKTAVGQLACVPITNGAIQSVKMADPGANEFDTEGCQCMVGGLGPGPYVFVNNYVEGSGTVWHHDDGGGYYATRGDYTYQRNFFHAPLSQMIGGASSDGLRYYHRHLLEWKSGCRIQLYGNIFDGGWTEDTPNGDFYELAADNGCGLSDFDSQNNTFRHGSTINIGPSTITGGTLKPAPVLRYRFQNNLGWDLNGYVYCAYGYGFCPPGGGWANIFGIQSNEDIIFNHNTFVGTLGQQPAIMWASETRTEGINFTNNVFYLNTSDIGAGFDLGNVCGLSGSGTDAGCYGAGRQCSNLSGKSAMDCAFQNYAFDHNLITGQFTGAQLQSTYPSPLTNYIPATPSNLNALGWFSYLSPTSTVNDYHMKGIYASGGGSHGNDGLDVGVNMDALLAAQGAVTLIGVPTSSITANSAIVSFVAPDGAGCAVDYSSTDPIMISNFTRVSDPGGAITRNMLLSGLSSGTVYYYRVDCAVQQPMGRFKTR